MAVTVGQTVVGTGNYKTYQTSSGGGQTYDMTPDAQGKVTEVRGNYANVDYRGIGGGTGWVPMAALTAFTPPTSTAPTTTPQSPDQVQPYLESLQGTLAQKANNGVQTPQEILSGFSDILPSMNQRPTAPSLVQTYQDLSKTYGVTQLQQDLNDLTAQEQQIVANRRIRLGNEENKPVAMNVIEGRQSEANRQESENLDFVQRQKAYKQTELQSALGVVQTMMDLTQKDFANASQQYDSQFNQAISMINLVHGIQQDQKTDQQRALDNARANMTVYVNLLKDGNISLANMSPDQKLQLQQLEIASGLGAGFLSKIQPDPKASMLSANELTDGRTQILWRNPDGTVRTEVVGNVDTYKVQAAQADIAAKNRANQPKPTAETKTFNELVKSASDVFNRIGNGDKYIDKGEAQQAKTAIVAMVGDQADAASVFDQAFASGKFIKYKW